MSVLLIRLCGAMQSWGTKSRFYDRDTEDFPSKSGVLGIVGAALGRDRAENISDLTALKFGVRKLKSGGQKKEWQTVEEPTDDKNYGFPYRKYYLSDADFVAGLEGDRALLEQINSALRNPVYPLFLGRKSYVAAKPFSLPENGIVETPLYDALRDFRYHSIIDGEEIKRMKYKYFDSEKKVRKDWNEQEVVYEQTMLFDVAVLVGQEPILNTKLQDLPISFADRNYMLRDVSLYQVQYDIEKDLAYLNDGDIKIEKGGTDVPE